MSPLAKKKLEGVLEQKGFSRSNSRHEKYIFYWEGKKTPVHTVISHGGNEYSDNLLGLVARQLKLTRGQLDNFVECPLTKEDYVILLQNGGHI